MNSTATIRLLRYVQGLGHPEDLVSVDAEYADRLAENGVAEILLPILVDPVKETPEVDNAPVVPDC